MANPRTQVKVTLHVTVEVTDRAALFAAATADPSLPEEVSRLYATDAAAAVQALLAPQRVVDGIPGVSYRECVYDATMTSD